MTCIKCQMSWGQYGELCREHRLEIENKILTHFMGRVREHVATHERSVGNDALKTLIHSAATKLGMKRTGKEEKEEKDQAV